LGLGGAAFDLIDRHVEQRTRDCSVASFADRNEICRERARFPRADIGNGIIECPGGGLIGKNGIQSINIRLGAAGGRR